MCWIIVDKSDMNLKRCRTIDLESRFQTVIARGLPSGLSMIFQFFCTRFPCCLIASHCLPRRLAPLCRSVNFAYPASCLPIVVVFRRISFRKRSAHYCHRIDYSRLRNSWYPLSIDNENRQNRRPKIKNQRYHTTVPDVSYGRRALQVLHSHSGPAVNADFQKRQRRGNDLGSPGSRGRRFVFDQVEFTVIRDDNPEQRKTRLARPKIPDKNGVKLKGQCKPIVVWGIFGTPNVVAGPKLLCSPQ